MYICPGIWFYVAKLCALSTVFCNKHVEVVKISCEFSFRLLSSNKGHATHYTNNTTKPWKVMVTQCIHSKMYGLLQVIITIIIPAIIIFLMWALHRLIQGPVHPSCGLVNCTVGRVYPSNSASWTGNTIDKLLYNYKCLTILCYLSYYMVVKYGGMKICCKLRYFTGNFSD